MVVVLTPEQRLSRLRACAKRNGQDAQLCHELGDPATFGDALCVWRALSDYEVTRLELGYGDEIEW